MNGILSSEERLALLQSIETHRKWSSLDEKRICLVCNRVITGGELRVERASNQTIVRCPTEGCAATPDDWLYCASAPAAGPNNNPRRVDFSFPL